MHFGYQNSSTRLISSRAIYLDLFTNRHDLTAELARHWLLFEIKFKPVAHVLRAHVFEWFTRL